MKTLQEQMNHILTLGVQALEEYGLSVVPVGLEDKVPLIGWKKYQTERVDTEEFHDWCANGAPRSDGGSVMPFNIGTTTGPFTGIVVIDCDDMAAAQKVKDAGLWSPIRVRTRRGVHLYFKHPGYHVKTCANGLGINNVDVRGDGGFVVLPPSQSTFSDEPVFYTWEMEVDWSDMPVLPDLSHFNKSRFSKAVVVDNPEDIDLSGVNISMTSKSIWEQIATLVAERGPLSSGDGRNEWLNRFVGDQLFRGVYGDDLMEQIELFMDAFYKDRLGDTEVKKIVRSAVASDKRNHPERYDAMTGQPIVRRAANTVVSFPTFTGADADGEEFAPAECIAHPLIFKPRCIQVHGHAGSGKSLVLMNLAYNIALGKDWGPFAVRREASVLYVNYDMSPAKFREHVGQMADMYGKAPLFTGISATDARIASGLTLNSPAGLTDFFELVRQKDPEIVIIDTVREAWPGLDEHSSWAWAPVNKLCKELRDKQGRTVIMVHHSNKPSDQNLGREAGSTAQLNVLDMQAQVIQLVGQDYNNIPTDHEEKQSIEKELTHKAHSKGFLRDDYSYNKLLDLARAAGHHMRTPVALEFGKNRDGIPDANRKLIGFTEDTAGRPHVLAPKGGLQIALELRDKMTMDRIAGHSGLPISELKKFL